MNNNPAKDRFWEYLSKKIGKEKANEFMYTPEKNEPFTSPNSNTSSSLSICSSSFNSSNVNFSLSTPSRSTLSCSNLPKTISIAKRLKKLRDVEEDTCAICLDRIVERSSLPCKHEYCRECLEGWLKNSDRCPYCREKNEFFIWNGKKIPIEEKEYMVQELMEEGNFSLDYECYICDETNQGDTVLICDQCLVHACHPNCDERLRGRIPNQRETWLCHFCR